MSRVTGYPEIICKAPCVAATTANITLEDEQTIDGVSVVAGDRVIVKDQTDASENGIYICVDGGSWTRAVDMDKADDLATRGITVIDTNQSALYEITYTDSSYSPDTTEVTFSVPSGDSATYFKLNDANDRTVTGSGSVVFDGQSDTYNVTFQAGAHVLSVATGKTFRAGGSSGDCWFKESYISFNTYDADTDPQNTTSYLAMIGATDNLLFYDEDGLSFVAEGSGDIQFTSTSGLNFSQAESVELPSYTVATAPSSSAAGFIYVSDAARSPSGTGTLAYKDGSNWIDVTTGTTVTT